MSCEGKSAAMIDTVATSLCLGDDAVALVLGASGGIGRAISLALLHAGAEVTMHGRSAQRLRLPAEAGPFNHVPHYILADLTATNAAAEVASTVERRGRLDVLVLSVGTYSQSRDVSDLPPILSANVLGPSLVLYRLLPLLMESNGQIVFINSSQALQASAQAGQYAAAKHALKALADSLREQLNPDGVRVVSLFLGRTATPMQEQVFALENRHYTPERLIQPCDVARLVIALLALPRTAEVTDLIMRPMQKP